MKKIGNKGFAISGIVYSILVLFVILLMSILTILSGRKVILDKARKDITARIDEQDSEKIDVSDYTQNGLIIHYDGIKNQRNSNQHSNSATVWENLVATSYDGTLTGSNYSWEGDGLLFNGSSYVNMGELNIENSNEPDDEKGSVTFEVVVKYTTQGNKETSTLIGNLNNGGYSLYHWYNPPVDWQFEAKYANHTLSFYNPQLRSTQSLSSANETKVNIKCDNNTSRDYIYSLSGVIDKKEKTLYIYENGMLFESTLASLSLGNPQAGTELSLGAKVINGSASSYLKGKIYSVRVYNRALQSYEIYKNYAIDRSRFEMVEFC